MPIRMHLPANRSAAVDDAARALLAPFDALRSAGLRLAGRSLGPWLVDPALRVAALGTASLVVGLYLVCRFPGLFLLFGPIVLGVPHLLADLRYLVVRNGFHRRAAVLGLTLVPCALALVHPALEVAGIGLLGAALASGGSTARRLVLSLAGVSIIALARVADRRAEIAFAHLHNAIAFAWMLVGFARDPLDRARLGIPVLVAALGGVLILSGFVGPAAGDAARAFDASGTPLWLLRHQLSPVEDPVLGNRFVLVFAFGQSAHYAVWLRFVPELARERPAPRSFRRSYDALRNEFGIPFLLFVTLVALAFPVAAFVDASMARDAYLRLALFHGPLEIALAGLLFSERSVACRS